VPSPTARQDPPPSSLSTGDARCPHGWALVLVLLLACAAYLPSLTGGWVWDDWVQVAHNPTLDRPLTLLSGDIRAGTAAAPTHHYRPLVMLSHLPAHALGLGPRAERGVNLGLHLLAVLLVYEIALRLGARRPGAWLGAAVLAVHPGASEAVAWISGRHDLVPAVLLLGAWWAFLGQRVWLAGALLALTPFCKETYLVVPLCAALWALGARRPAWPMLALSLVGVLVYLGLRHHLGLALPLGATLGGFAGAAGAMAQRGLQLTFLPLAPDAVPPFAPHPALGLAAMAAGLGLLPLARGRPAIAGFLACALLLGPSSLAARRLGLVGDRYFYVFFCGLGALLAVGVRAECSRLASGALAAGLALLTSARASQWTSDHALFAASLTRDPHNPHAAFHLAYDLHTRADDCASAIPLYERGLAADVRAGTNMLACLNELGRHREAATRGAALASAHPEHLGLAKNTAEAFASLGQLAQAEAWCQRAIALAPERCDLQVMLGNLLGQQGRLDEAEAAFEAALRLGAACAPQAR